MIGERNAFIGRQQEIAAILRLLNGGQRLVTITGPAGIGKTRLARHVKEQWDAGAEQPASWFCDCSTIDGVPAMIVGAARSLGLNAAAGGVDEVEALVGRALAGHACAMLVLDNLEHLLPGSAEVLSRWLDAAGSCQLLVTSRELLRVEGEVVFDLGPLPEARALFLDRARMIRRDYACGSADGAAVERIVERLDGIPLAVELAAARARILSPAALLEQLDASMETLSRGPRHARSRQATMHEALIWSWNLLDALEQTALAVVSVFRGGFSLEDAQGVLRDACGIGETDALELVQALRDKSLIHECDGADPTRFDLYELIRRFGLQQLQALGLEERSSDAHARYFVRRGRARLDGAAADDFSRTMVEIGLDRANLEGVLDRCSKGDPGRIELGLGAAVLLGAIASDDGLPPVEAAALERLLAMPLAGVEPELVLRGRLVRVTKQTYTGQPVRAEGECRDIIEEASAGGLTRVYASACLSLGATLLRQGKATNALAVLREAEARCREAGDTPGEQHAICQQGGCAHSLGSAPEALELFERGLAIAKAWGLVRGETRAEAGLGSHYLVAGDFIAAEQHLERCGELARSIGLRRTGILVTGHLGILNFDHDRLVEALEYLTAAVAEAAESGDDVPEGVFLAAEAAVRASMGDTESAAPLLAKAQRVLATSPLFRTIVEVYGGHLDIARARALPRSTGVLRKVKQLIEDAKHAKHGDIVFVEQSDDLRVALRLLERAMSRLVREVGSESKPPAPIRTLLVGPDTAWFEIDGERRVDMSRRSTSRAILDGLVDAAASGRGEVTVDELLAMGWPGEKMTRSSALNRLYVALATLRSMGLRDVLERGPRGYVLRASVARA